jgi:hypothetical protein
VSPKPPSWSAFQNDFQNCFQNHLQNQPS